MRAGPRGLDLMLFFPTGRAYGHASGDSDSPFGKAAGDGGCLPSS